MTPVQLPATRPLGQELLPLLLWWSCWSLADRFLLRYSPISELMGVSCCIVCVIIAHIRGENTRHKVATRSVGVETSEPTSKTRLGDGFGAGAGGGLTFELNVDSSTMYRDNEVGREGDRLANTPGARRRAEAVDKRLQLLRIVQPEYRDTRTSMMPHPDDN